VTLHANVQAILHRKRAAEADLVRVVEPDRPMYWFIIVVVRYELKNWSLARAALSSACDSEYDTRNTELLTPASAQTRCLPQPERRKPSALQG
jgi:hypothetical protein